MRIVVKGTVQGVGFRPAVHRIASSLGLNGRVWNDGSDVVIDVDDGNELIRVLKGQLPPLAVIDSIEMENRKFDPLIKGFSIIPSAPGNRGVSIPTDTTICDSCLKEIRSQGRRKGYAFTTCTNCGARFTLISRLPYDRDSTAMKDFPKCEKCSSEYSDPTDRRFHHQTICCPECGPHYYLIDKDGKPIDGDPIPTFAKMIDSGLIGVAKSWGGMHICATLENTIKLRKWYGRGQKPFAIMVRDINSVKNYANPSKKEIEHLTSGHRPIVLMEKIENDTTEAISPKLNNIGIFLPYTGMQHLLFDHLDHDALIMTSANVPGEPMILNDKDIMELCADVYLLHNQRIINRADDSVIRTYSDNTFFIRKSRGHIPSFIPVKYTGSAVGIGAQENLTATVSSNGRLYTTQHIGNGESIGVIEYLESSTNSLIDMLGCKPQAIAMDLHPGYSNRKYGKYLAEKYNAKLIEVQHHWAHAASLLVEHDVDEAVILSIDGTGYGSDGNAWGGEVLRADLNSFERISHLQNIPLLGSEKALYDLRRLKFAVDCINGEDNHLMDDDMANIMRKLMNKSVMTSSLGRILDTLAFTLDVCKTRTYDGEPAMKMEPLLAKGKFISGFETEIKNGEIMTAHLFADIPKNEKKEDIAYSIVKTIIDAMVDSACDSAESHGIKRIGLSGGVSYDRPVCEMVETAILKRGLKFMTHNCVPNGDGGISVGQTAIALRSLE
ncbi:MAG: carbamoyltransferase HypF [Candidatus Methanomethylophilaceae archaeon]